MKKLKRANLAELAKSKTIIPFLEQRRYVGGGIGTQIDPFDYGEFINNLQNNHWSGGWVQGIANNDGFLSYCSGTVAPVYVSQNLMYKGGTNLQGITIYDGGTKYNGGNEYNGGTTLLSTIYDGVNIDDSIDFTFNTEGNEAFHSQLTEILRSNSVIKNLLSYFNKGIVHMTFGMENLPINNDTTVVARTTYASSESYHITFNEKLINSNGWNNPYDGEDNMGYDFSKAHTMEEKLLISLAHEAMHANHMARYQEAMRVGRREPADAARWLLKNGYSQEFVNIYFKRENGVWNTTSPAYRDERLHLYMKVHNQGVIDAALNEYRREHK